MLLELAAAAAVGAPFPVQSVWFRTPRDEVYCGTSARSRTIDAWTCFRPRTGFWIELSPFSGDGRVTIRRGFDRRLRGYRNHSKRVLPVNGTFATSDAAVVACKNRSSGLTCLHWRGQGWRLAPGRGAAVIGGPRPSLDSMTPRQKAALLVVSGLPAPPGVGGVIVRSWDRTAMRPPNALVFVDQEGGEVRAFPSLPPAAAAVSYRTPSEARAAGRATGRALARSGVDVDLAPVVDLATGPLGARHFRGPDLAAAFARGLREGGVGACAKHFPGLGTAAVSTDERPHVAARVTTTELGAFRTVIAKGATCVMTSHAFYGTSRFRASITPSTYRRLRGLGFRGVAITDSLSIVRAAPVERWSRQATRAGADLLLFTSPAHARRAIAALVPLAARGELDRHVQRVLSFRWELLAGWNPIAP